MDGTTRVQATGTLSHLVLQCPRCGGANVCEAHHASRRCRRCTAPLPASAIVLARCASAPEARARLVAMTSPTPIARPVERHDSTVEAAAAKASAITNLSQRAEAAALWLARLGGTIRHEELIQAFLAAAIPQKRAQAEVVRLLATDILYEPRPGEYRFVA